MPAVTISILAFHERETIGACLRSAMSLDYEGPLEICVREQGGDDAQFGIIEDTAAAATDNVRVTLSRGENVGFAPGHNLAIRSTSSEFVMLLNSDAVLDPQYLRQAIPAFDDPRVAAVQGKLVRQLPSAERSATDNAVIDTAGLTASRRRFFNNRGQGDGDTGQFDEPTEIFGADGAAPVYRRSALDDVAVPRALASRRDDDGTVEYLDESFFTFKCDVDLAWRLRMRGWKAVFVPTAVAGHVRTLRRGASSGTREVLALRRTLPPTGKLLSFSNHRLMLIKNDSPRALLRDCWVWLPYELGLWVVYMVTERTRWTMLRRLIRLAPTAWRKRRWVQGHRDPNADVYAWFT